MRVPNIFRSQRVFIESHHFGNKQNFSGKFTKYHQEEYEDIFFLHTRRDCDVLMSGDGGHESAAAGRGAARHPVPGHGGGPGQPRPGGSRGLPPGPRPPAGGGRHLHRLHTRLPVPLEVQDVTVPPLQTVAV